MDGNRAVIFVNGELRDAEALRQLLQPDDFLVAADGGLRHVFALGLTPHLLIGDLDSVRVDQVAEMEKQGVEIRRFPPEKDETDLELAVRAVQTAGYGAVLLVAATGGRLDQTLGSLYLLTDPAWQDGWVRLEDGREEVFLIRKTGQVHGIKGDVVSLLPVDEKASGITTQGLAYPLSNDTLFRCQTRGISNVMREETATIHVGQGALFCIHTRLLKS